jgi:hypothetical protein
MLKGRIAMNAEERNQQQRNTKINGKINIMLTM